MYKANQYFLNEQQMTTFIVRDVAHVLSDSSLLREAFTPFRVIALVSWH